jgi:hypothetical protein
MQVAGEMQATASRELVEAPFGLGVGLMVQFLPFQDSASA